MKDRLDSEHSSNGLIILAFISGSATIFKFLSLPTLLSKVNTSLMSLTILQQPLIVKVVAVLGRSVISSGVIVK